MGKEQKKMTRRDFLKGLAAAASAAVLAGCSSRRLKTLEAKPEPTPQKPTPSFTPTVKPTETPTARPTETPRPTEIPTPTEISRRVIEVWWLGGTGGPEIVELPFGVSPTPGVAKEVEIQTKELDKLAKEELAPFLLSFLPEQTKKTALAPFLDPENKRVSLVCFAPSPVMEEERIEKEKIEVLAIAQYEQGKMIGQPVSPSQESLINVGEMGRVFQAQEADEETGFSFPVVLSLDEKGLEIKRMPFWPKKEFNLLTGQWKRVDWPGFLKERGFALGEGWELLKSPLPEDKYEHFEKSLQQAVFQAYQEGKDKGEIRVEKNQETNSPEAHFYLFVTPTPEPTNTPEPAQPPDLSRLGLQWNGEYYQTIDNRWGIEKGKKAGEFLDQAFLDNGQEKRGLIGLHSTIIEQLVNQSWSKDEPVLPLMFDPHNQKIEIMKIDNESLINGCTSLKIAIETVLIAPFNLVEYTAGSFMIKLTKERTKFLSFKIKGRKVQVLYKSGELLLVGRLGNISAGSSLAKVDKKTFQSRELLGDSNLFIYISEPTTVYPINILRFHGKPVYPLF